MPSPAFLNAIGPGYYQGLGNLNRLDLDALRIKQAQQELAALRNQQLARELGGAALMMDAEQPALARPPATVVGPAPQPGQASVPRGGFTMGGAAGELPGAAPPQMPAVGATPMPQAPAMGATPGIGVGAFGGARAGAAPSAPAQPPQQPSAGPGQMSLRDLARRLKAQYPGASNEQIFMAMGNLQQLLLPQERMQYQLLLQEVRMQHQTQLQQGRLDQQTRENELKRQGQSELQAERLRSQAEINAARNEAAMARTQAGISGRLDALERGNQFKAEQGELNRGAAMARTQAQVGGRAGIADRKHDDKLMVPIKSLDDFAAQAEQLAKDIEANPGAVGARGIGSRLLSTGYETITGAPYDTKAQEIQNRLRDLQSTFRVVVQGNKNYSGQANANLQQLMQGLGALEPASTSADSIRLQAQRARDAARIMRSELRDQSRGVTEPAPGDVQDGYRFKGGDPADPASWEAVQ